MWTLLLSRQGDPPGSFIDRRQIDSGEIKVGRNPATCDLVVPDTAGHLSREHCTITAIGFDLFVVDTSTNGVTLNQPGQRIAPQTPVAIRIGDRLLIGDFAIEVASEAAGLAAPLHAPAAPPGAQRFQQPDAWFDATPSASDPIWGSGPSRAEVHDFLGDAMHDFLASPAQARGGPAAGFDPFGGGAFGEAFSKPLLAEPVAAAPSAFAIPEDWAAPPSAAPTGGDPFAGSGKDDGASADPFAGSAAPRFEGPAPLTPSGPGEATPAPLSSAPDPLASPPPPAAPPPPPIASAPGPRRSEEAFPSAPTGGDADWAAFCKGAGLDPVSFRTSPQSMYRLGILYRQVVLGLSDLIQDRAAFKDEFRVERTQLSFGRNNPLKHLTAIETGKILLADPLPGFMNGEEAVRAGFEDVKRHQLALLAGVQHALKAVFDRLSPSEVDRVMKMATGAKRGILGRGVDPWSVYQTMFEALRTDATSNVNSVMSVAFREGYEAFLKSTPGGAG